VALIASTLQAGQKVRCADNPEASTLELHLRAVIAEEERRAISARTKAALEAAKRRGAQLGSSRPGHWRGREALRRAGGLAGSVASAVARKKRSAGLLEQARPIVEAHASASLRELARALEAARVLTAQGCERWTAMGAKRLREALA
jgi:DNA invertase Pin-like site-specific DNA recombinase